MKKQKTNNQYALTVAELRILKWIRLNSGDSDWTGTIRFVSGPDIYQMADHKPAGRVNGRN